MTKKMAINYPGIPLNHQEEAKLFGPLEAICCNLENAEFYEGTLQLKISGAGDKLDRTQLFQLMGAILVSARNMIPRPTFDAEIGAEFRFHSK